MTHADDVPTSMHLRSLPHRKQYGQFFTPASISALACATAIGRSAKRIIDPMCGSGVMLQAACERLVFLGNDVASHIVGVEIDDEVAKVAAEAIKDCAVPNQRIISGDAFTTLGRLTEFDIDEPAGSFDAVVGNPPYVRYQNLSGIYEHNAPKVVDAFRGVLGGVSNSVLVDSAIRVSLISHLLTSTDQSVARKVRDGVKLLRSPRGASDLAPVDACWLRIIASYSGLSDLSLPAWLLTWRLTKAGGNICYVTTASWRSREYARVLRYFMLRMLKPVLVVEQEGTWFGDALIPTTLMMFTARTQEEANVPLGARTSWGDPLRIVRINRNFDLADPIQFQLFAERISDTFKNSTVHNLAEAADAVAQSMLTVEGEAVSDYCTVSLVSEQELAESLLYEDRAARVTNRNGTSLDELEDAGFVSSASLSIKTRTSPGYRIPHAVRQSLGINSTPEDGFTTLSQVGVEIHQGLRTGCNSFFYVRLPQETDLHKIFPDQAPTHVQAVLNDPHGRPEEFSAIVARFESVGAWVPSEPATLCGPSVAVSLDQEFDSRWAVFPKSVLLPVVTGQKSLTHWRISDPEALMERAVVTGPRATLQDFLGLMPYPEEWIQVWKTRDQLTQLPSSIARYILWASHHSVSRNGKLVPIPQLSAVSPNVRRPPIPNAQMSFDEEPRVPEPPAWWYTLTIKARHRGEVFMPRVNNKSPKAFLNSAGTPALIDANFSTFLTNSNHLPAQSLFALLNSTWIQACLEVLGTPLGGGALKVEAAQLRTIPIPQLTKRQVSTLNDLGQHLAGLPLVADPTKVLKEIDELINSAVANVLNLRRDELDLRLNSVVTEYQARRRPRAS